MRPSDTDEPAPQGRVTAHALTVAQADEAEPVVLDLERTLRAVRHETAHGRQAGLDEAGRRQRHSKLNHSIDASCNPEPPRPGVRWRAPGQWVGRARGRNAPAGFLLGSGPPKSNDARSRG